jgi:hypothetical protein
MSSVNALVFAISRSRSRDAAGRARSVVRVVSHEHKFAALPQRNDFSRAVNAFMQTPRQSFPIQGLTAVRRLAIAEKMRLAGVYRNLSGEEEMADAKGSIVGLLYSFCSA